MVYQAFFLVLFLASLVLMTDAGIRRLPVRWLFHLDPLAALSVLMSSWVLPATFLWALVIVALTVVFGRAFCGWICPVGTLHHLVSWATRRWRRGPADHVNRWRSHFLTKYLLLVAVLAVALMGSLQAGLLDPLSLAARSFGSGLFPAGHGLLSTGEFHPRLVQGVWLTAGLFIVLLVANRWIARWWCRALCPLGALLGWVSRYAIFRIRVDPERCTQCNLCAADCQGADEPFGEHRGLAGDRLRPLAAVPRQRGVRIGARPLGDPASGGSPRRAVPCPVHPLRRVLQRLSHGRAPAFTGRDGRRGPVEPGLDSPARLVRAELHYLRAGLSHRSDPPSDSGSEGLDPAIGRPDPDRHGLLRSRTLPSLVHGQAVHRLPGGLPDEPQGDLAGGGRREWA
jgi:hypothetical protein